MPVNYRKLAASFYLHDDVLWVARNLLGKLLCTHIDGLFCCGRIVETEAYNGVGDKASHAYGGRRTARTDVMFREGGLAYVYLCYGIHHMFNVVSAGADHPHATLVRAIEPVEGKEEMLSRSGKKKWDHSIGSGPGNVCKAMGIRTSHTGQSLQGDLIWLADDGYRVDEAGVARTPRIGVDYAGEDAKRLYRFIITASPFVSAGTFTRRFLSGT